MIELRHDARTLAAQYATRRAENLELLITEIYDLQMYS